MPTSHGPAEHGHDDADLGDVVDAIDANTAVELAGIRTEMKEVRALIATVFGLDAMTQVLENGFGTLSDQLRLLVPPSTAASLEPPVAQRIERLRDALRAPDVSNIGRLEVGYTSVSFGDPPLDGDDRKGGSAS